MNVIKILLVLGLGYVALTQKSEKTRNILLVVTGLLAFCMFSVEGITLQPTQMMSEIFSDTIYPPQRPGNLTGGRRNADGPVTVESAKDRYSFTGTEVITLDGSAVIDPSIVTCKTGLSGNTLGTVGYKTGVTNWDNPATAATIDDYLTCIDAAAGGDEPQLCTVGTATKSDDLKCADYYTDKTDGKCAAYPCKASDFSSDTDSNCCEKVCSDDKCEISFLGAGDGAKCKEFPVLPDWLVSYKCPEQHSDIS